MIVDICSITEPAQCPYDVVNGTDRCLEHADICSDEVIARTGSADAQARYGSAANYRLETS